MAICKRSPIIGSPHSDKAVGLGIEAQPAAVARLAEAEGIAIIQELTEVETGKGVAALNRRPQLTAALALQGTARDRARQNNGVRRRR
jgi:hypothetical protein